MHGSYKSYMGVNLTVLEKMHQFIIGGGGVAQSVRGNYTFFEGDKCDGFEKNAPV